MEHCASCLTRRILCVAAAAILGCHFAYVKMLAPSVDSSSLGTMGTESMRTSASRSIELTRPLASQDEMAAELDAHDNFDSAAKTSSARGTQSIPQVQFQQTTDLGVEQPPAEMDSDAWMPPSPAPTQATPAPGPPEPEPTQWGVTFSYKPYVAPLPVVLDDEAWSQWEHDPSANGGKTWLEVHRKCVKIAAESKDIANQAGLVEGKDILICDPNHPSGNHTDVLLFRRNLKLPPMGCSKMRKQPFKEGAPDPSLFKSDVGSDIIGYDSWSFQHFLEGPVMRLVQNLEYYQKYNAQVLAQLRIGTGSYHNPVVPLIYEKAGLRSQLKGWCGGYNTLQPCRKSFTPELSVACSWPKMLPDLAVKWRKLMGVAESLPAGGKIVMFTRGGALQSHKGRNFVNPKEMGEALQGVATEYGLEYVETTNVPWNSIEAITKYFADVRLFVGAHGGAMWNFYFMPRGAGLIEISGNGYPTFWKHMAGYGSYYGPLKVPMSGGNDHLRADLHPEPERLAKLARKVLERTGARPVPEKDRKVPVPEKSAKSEFAHKYTSEAQAAEGSAWEALLQDSALRRSTARGR